MKVKNFTTIIAGFYFYAAKIESVVEFNEDQTEEPH